MIKKWSVNIKVKIWFFDVYRVMKPVVVAKILQEFQLRPLALSPDERQKIKL